MNEITRLMQAGGYAFEGLIYLIKEQKNTRLLLITAVLSLIICPLLGFSAIETSVVFFMVIVTTIAEVLNTSIEVTLDLQTQGRYNSKVKIAKDVAACAVLLGVISSIMVFSIILFANVFAGK